MNGVGALCAYAHFDTPCYTVYIIMQLFIFVSSNEREFNFKPIQFQRKNINKEGVKESTED